MIQELERLLERFGPPFLPLGFVKTRRLDDIYGQPALNVQIGDRDATILQNGEVTGSGTAVGEAVEWHISTRTITEART